MRSNSKFFRTSLGSSRKRHLLSAHGNAAHVCAETPNSGLIGYIFVLHLCPDRNWGFFAYPAKRFQSRIPLPLLSVYIIEHCHFAVGGTSVGFIHNGGCEWLRRLFSGIKKCVRPPIDVNQAVQVSSFAVEGAFVVHAKVTCPARK